MNKKYSDREKYNPNDKNDYSAPKEKPPRYDLRRKHRVVDDPLEKKDRNTEDKMAADGEKELDEKELDEKEVVKKVARNKIAGRPTSVESGFNLQREGLDNYSFKDKGVRSVAKTYKNLAEAFLCMSKAVNNFTSCKSSEISPDGKLGGKGYIQPIKNIRSSMAECLNLMSELIDTFHDEVNSPYWKKTTIEENPVVLEILNLADKAIDEAEELDGQDQLKGEEKIALNDEEKKKVLSILKSKGYL
jgi:hypothetical protein